jgi:hypothetical protein
MTWRRHDDAQHTRASEPSPWVERFAPLVPAEALVLDLAAGQAATRDFFASRGARVVAVDRDADALSRRCGTSRESTRGFWISSRPVAAFGRALRRDRRHELSASPFAAFASGHLSDDGVLIYETFARRQRDVSAVLPIPISCCRKTSSCGW